MVYQVAQQVDPLRVPSPGRFVQDHDGGVHRDYGRGCYTFALRYSQVVRLLLSYRFQPHEIYCSGDQTFRFLGTRTHVVGPEAHFFLHRAPEELVVRVLEDQSHLSGEHGDPVLPPVLFVSSVPRWSAAQQSLEVVCTVRGLLDGGSSILPFTPTQFKSACSSNGSNHSCSAGSIST